MVKNGVVVDDEESLLNQPMPSEAAAHRAKASEME